MWDGRIEERQSAGKPSRKIRLEADELRCDVGGKEKRFGCWRVYFIPGGDGLCTSANLEIRSSVVFLFHPNSGGFLFAIVQSLSIEREGLSC